MTPSGRAFIAVIAIVMSAGCSQDAETIATEPSPVESSPSALSEYPQDGSPPQPNEIAQRLGPAPDDCRGPAPRPRTVSPAYGKLVGEEPLWAGFYASYEEEAQAFSAPDAPRRRYGFRVKVLWIMSPRQEAPITLTGTNLATDRPLYFDVEDLATRDTDAVLDPTLAGTGEHGWRELPSYIYFDGAGCFELEASWERGSWRLVFGLGR